MRLTPADSEPLLVVKDLEVTFAGRRRTARAVRGVDFEVARGGAFGIVGESGSGKSLSMLAVMGLLPPGAKASGSIRLCGQELIGMRERDLRHLRGSQMGMIFQDPMTSLNPVFTIGDQIAEAIRVHDGKVSRRQGRDRAVALLEAVSIPNPSEKIDAYPFELSGGMRQRVMIAVAIANNPPLLIADEPTTALDVTIQAQILEVLKQIGRDLDVGLVLITHDLGVVAGMVEEVAVMYSGRVVERAAVRELFARPRHPYTRGLLACLPRLDGDRGALTPIGGSPPSIVDIPAGCAFHPRCVFCEDRCRVEDPALRRVEHSAVACHLAERLGPLALRPGLPALRHGPAQPENV